VAPVVAAERGRVAGVDRPAQRVDHRVHEARAPQLTVGDHVHTGVDLPSHSFGNGDVSLPLELLKQWPMCGIDQTPRR